VFWILVVIDYALRHLTIDTNVATAHSRRLDVLVRTEETRSMKSLVDLLTFRRMISPIILQLLFWSAVGGVFYGSYVLIALGNWAWPLALVFGTLAVRVMFELAILAFRTYDRLGEIRDALRPQ
jgi:hypothetical protein